MHRQHPPPRFHHQARQNQRLHLCESAMRHVGVRIPFSFIHFPPCSSLWHYAHRKPYPSSHIVNICPCSEAEITGGLICSCIVVLPRFFQDVLRVVPYSYPTPSRGKWVQMDDRTQPQGSDRKKSVPAGWNDSRGERALDEAVHGVSARPKEGV